MARHKLKPNASRNIRLADQIQKDLAILIQRELDASLYGLITISGVDLSADYAHAKVYFTVMAGDPEVAGEALQEKASWFHGQLFKMLHIHTVPVLHFIHDQHMALGIAMSQLIDDAVRSDQKHHADNQEPPADNSDQS